MLIDVTRKTESNYKPGENPKSLKNLEKRGRTPVYDEHKKRREVIVTETGWEGFKQLAKDVGLSASELIERLGRGTVQLAEYSERDKGKDAH